VSSVSLCFIQETSISPKVIYARVKEENGRVVQPKYSTTTGSVQATVYSLFFLYCRASSVLGLGLDSGDLSAHLDYISKHPFGDETNP
jgi:hypothetical protein